MCETYHRECIEQMKGTEFPDRPGGRVSIDFFQHKDKHNLLSGDYFSRDEEICQVSKCKLCPDYSTAEKEASVGMGFQTSYLPTMPPSLINGSLPPSPHTGSFSTYPYLQDSQSDREVNRAVQTLSMIQNKSSAEQLALLNYRLRYSIASQHNLAWARNCALQSSVTLMS